MPRPSLTAGIIAGVAAACYAGAVWAGMGAQTMAHAQDLLWPAGELDPRVVVVAIDDESIEQLGEWPWSRTTQAGLVNALADAGVMVIGYDILLPEEVDGEDPLADAMADVPVVVAEGFSSAAISDRGLFEASGAVEPAAGIKSSAAAVGHTMVTADTDGLTRTVPLIVDVPGEDFSGSLAFRVADLVDGITDQMYVRPDAVQAGGLTVPTEDGAVARVQWSPGFNTGSPQVVSAADVINGTADPANLDGAVVFVGATAVALGDRHVTPLQLGVTTPGVVVQAEVASTILSGGWVTPVPTWWSVLAVAAASFGLAFAALRWKLRWVVMLTVAAVLVYIVAAVAIFGMFGFLADTVRVPVVFIGSVVVAVSIRLLAEQRERRRTVDLFTRYVPEHVAEHLLRSGRAAEAAAGERVHIGVMFCDLRGFTPLTASLEPGQVREILDKYYDYACARIFANNGTVMQFVGDEVFAVFGAPDPVEIPGTAARATGLALQADISELKAELAAAGLPPVSFGVSVHIGDVVAAHVGPAHRRQYAVIGDPINVGSRLCGQAKAGEVVMSVAAAGDRPAGTMELLELKGVAGQVPVVRLTPETPAPARAGVDRSAPYT
ncbi:hypothetical protein ASF62_02665 [Leifsonia sp. Leaf325]|nr:adenylate/guanylate cyclase domain-containing protein [Leifsonia sp. Leaf325]KQQ95447.1 hypothetical protein ASF62_02665 [Leifsonia sp. Leaf325]